MKVWLEEKLRLVNKDILIFVSIVCLSAILRIISLGNFETTTDEKLSVCEANGLVNYNFKEGVSFTQLDLQKHNTIQNVMTSTVLGDGGNGIMYIMCLHYWTKLFGNSDYAVQFFSVILGILVVIIAYFLCMEMIENRKLAIIIMFLISIHPQLISYSQEMRAYMLALLFTMTASLVLLKLTKRAVFNFKHLFFYALLVSASFLSHYSTVYIFLAQIFVLFFLFRIGLKNWGRLIAVLFISAGIISVWMWGYGFEGLKIISNRNQHYMDLSLMNPAHSFFMKTGLYSICAGWVQNLLTFSGNTIVKMGYQIHIVLPLFLIPSFILFYGIKKTEKQHHLFLKINIILGISSLIYATILSIIANHIISFQLLYSIFSLPYFIFLIGLSIYLLLNTIKTKFSLIVKLFILMQVLIMLFSIAIIYFGFDVDNIKSVNKYQLAQSKIKAIQETEKDAFVIIYKDAGTASEMNKYLGGSLSNIKQIIHKSESNPTLYLFFIESQNKMILLK